ncbi:UMP kinase [Candidatus Peregrinibacteria bacterium]|nr:MAG: UMP kinase [Candidatus Peregrinibacteria bacterium]
MKKRRILLKLSGEVLGGPDGIGADGAALMAAALGIQSVVKKNIQVAVVVGGGNFWRYRDNKSLAIARTTSDAVGMMATFMNARLLAEALKTLKVKTRVLAAHGNFYFAEPYVPEFGRNCLDRGEVVLCAGGTGNPYFTTDTAAALRALELECDELLKDTKVEGVYDSDPMKNKKAKLFSKLTHQEVLDRELGVMDLTAVLLCKDNGLPVRVFNGRSKGNLLKAALGKSVGTLIS